MIIGFLRAVIHALWLLLGISALILALLFLAVFIAAVIADLRKRIKHE